MTLLQQFWRWYERHYLLAIGFSAGLFLLQIFHLVWLATDVIATRLLGYPLFEPVGLFALVLVFVDYLEIPTLISVSLIYLNELRQRVTTKNLLYLIMLNSQWLHLFWITDEVIEEVLTGHGSTVLPTTLAWLAILIDYLEVPVIIDTVRRFSRAVRQRRATEFLQDEFATKK